MPTIGGSVLAPDLPPPAPNNGRARLRHAIVLGAVIVTIAAMLWQHWAISQGLESIRDEQRERERFVVAALVAEPEDRRFLRETLSEMDPLVARLLRRAAERKSQYFRERMLEGDELGHVPRRTTPPLIEQRTPRPQAP